MKKFTTSILLIIGSAAGPHALFAQDVGERVRVTTVDGRVVGQVVETDDDRFTLSGGGSFRHIDIIGLERSTGRGSAWKRGLVWGGAVGAVGGTVLGAWASSLCFIEACDDDDVSLRTALVGGVIFGAAGGVAGMGIGALLLGPERWESIPLGSDIVGSPLAELRLRGGSPAARFGARITF